MTKSGIEFTVSCWNLSSLHSRGCHLATRSLDLIPLD